MTRLKVGFIGAGRIADLHARAYADNPDADLAAVADAVPGRARARADEWGAAQAFEDYRELLAAPGIDAVEILLPHALHSRVGIEALEAGKAVSMQKPPGVSLTEADALFNAAGRANTVFRVFDNFLYWEPFRIAKSLIDAGEIGDPLLFRIGAIYGRGQGGWTIPAEATAWRANAGTAGGPTAIVDHGAHMAATMVFFMGGVEAVHAFDETSDATSAALVNAPLAITCRFAHGRRLGVWTMARTSEVPVPTDYYPGDEFVEIAGTSGVIWVNRCSGKLVDGPPVTLLAGGRTRHFDDVELDWGESFRAGGEAFVRGIIDGTQPDMDAAFAREVFVFQLAAMRSAAEGREVTTAEVARP